MASICKACVLMLSTGCGEKNDAKLSAVCMRDYEGILADCPPPEETGKRSCGASPQRWDKASLDNMTTMPNTCL